MSLLLTIFSFLALAALWFACYGGFHQAYVTYKEKNAAALAPERFEGVCIANTIWTLYACSLPEINYPLALGCSAWVIAGLVNLSQVLLFPPQRSAAVRLKMVTIFSLSILIMAALLLAVLFEKRTYVQEWNMALQWAAVASTFFLVHIGQLFQMFRTAERKTLEGVSRWDVIAPFTDWSIFIIYSLLLGPFQFWPILVNSLFGFVTSGMRLLQYLRMGRSKH